MARSLPARFPTSFFFWLVNMVLFYGGWILALKLVLQDRYFLAPLVVFTIVLIHLLFVARDRGFELFFIASLTLLGSLVDSSFAFFGIIHYQGSWWEGSWLAPGWIISLWALFATSINHALAWLSPHRLTAALLGAIGGTLSYMSAISVGAATLEVAVPIAIALIALTWGVVMPLIFVYNDWLKSHYHR